MLNYKRFMNSETKQLLAVPRSFVNDIMCGCHNSLTAEGHAGVAKTLSKIRLSLASHVKDIIQYTKTYHNCQIMKTLRHKEVDGKLSIRRD